MANPTPQTIFTCDILGNYVCNTFAEAMASGLFDVVIIGGGTFGLALAQDLFYRSRTTGLGSVPEDGLKPSNYRILVLEAGPFTLPEHVQDIPSLGLSNPGIQAPFPPGSGLPATRQELINQGKDKQAIFEVWGLPWNSTERFGGLAYCVGGRSLYFGGWSPRYLETEMPTAPVGTISSATLWPLAVMQDLTLEKKLKKGFLLDAAKQTGVSAANDFLNGDLQDFYRKKLFDNYATIPNKVPLAELPDYVAEAPEDVTPGLALQLASPPYPNFQESLKVDAPLSVQALSRPGFFPGTPPAPGTVIQLFDGTTLVNWRMAGRGTFHVIDGALQSAPSFELGLLWCTIPMPMNYRLELEFFLRTVQTNSGIFVRFRNPESFGYYNPAWSTVDSGFEIQIDNTGAPDSRAKHKTGAVYGVNYPNDPPDDPKFPPAQPGDFVNPKDAQVLVAWNQYRIDVQGDVISVNLNGVNTAKYTNTDPSRGRFSATESTFIGLQSYSNYGFTTAFRKIRATVL